MQANRAEQDPRTVKRLLDDTRAQLHEMRHPDPYRRTYSWRAGDDGFRGTALTWPARWCTGAAEAASPEGSKWERNTPPPPHVRAPLRS